jgi:host factor-I protein
MMTSPLSSRRRSKTPPPGETGQEALYLRSLSDRQVVVQVKLRDGDTVRGWIEYFDGAMLRLTREGQPNLFIYKHQIRTIGETGRRKTIGVTPQNDRTPHEAARHEEIS